MPRIRQKADEYAMNDFVAEINAQRARYGFDTHALLAQKIGVCQATASNYLRKPETIRLDALRSLVKQLRLDPVIVLKMLGYSQRDINNIASRLDPVIVLKMLGCSQRDINKLIRGNTNELDIINVDFNGF